MKNTKTDNYRVKMKLRIPEKIKVFTMAIQLHFEMKDNVRFLHKMLKHYIQKKTEEYSKANPNHDRFTLTIRTEEFKLIEPVSLIVLIKKKRV